MHHLRIYIAIIILLTPIAAYAYTPPLSLPTERRVKLSSHIFIGEIRSVNFVDESGKIISPKQAAQIMDRLHITPIFQTKLHIRETLLSREGKLPQLILYRYPARGAGYFQTEERAQELAKWLSDLRSEIGQQYIFFTERIVESGRQTYFIPIYATPDREDTSQKTAVLKATRGSKRKKRTRR